MENIKIIDSHTHYAHPKFDKTRSEILDNLPKQGIVTVIEAAIGYDSNKKMLELCEQYPYIYAAIGETGLDYSKTDDVEYIALQKKWFVRFIELALEYQMPLVIHCRDAYNELLEIMSGYDFGNNPGIIHCFSGDSMQARRFTVMRFLLGVGGKFLKSKDNNQELKAVLKEVPIDKIVLETDAPYLKPDGVPGKYNTSLNLRFIAEELAKLKM